ncbi:hypothetical protein AMECASPLE_015984 [Ameca splendens]|uniref:Uncharacterized protein n=1 Tax=Ameca splendens TaxID=208324 RepID=A0ABV0YD41_9TELE
MFSFLGWHATFASIPHLLSVYRSAFQKCATESVTSLCSFIISVPHFSTLSVHQEYFLFPVASSRQGKPISSSWNSPKPKEITGSSLTNQSAAKTAAKLFTGSEQQAFCVRLL